MVGAVRRGPARLGDDLAKGGDAAVLDLLAAAPDLPLMGLHRRVLRRIGDETRAALAGFWVRLGLFETLDEAGRCLRRRRREPPCAGGAGQRRRVRGSPVNGSMRTLARRLSVLTNSMSQ